MKFLICGYFLIDSWPKLVRTPGILLIALASLAPNDFLIFFDFLGFDVWLRHGRDWGVHALDRHSFSRLEQKDERIATRRYLMVGQTRYQNTSHLRIRIRQWSLQTIESSHCCRFYTTQVILKEKFMKTKFDKITLIWREKLRESNFSLLQRKSDFSRSSRRCHGKSN